MKILVLDNYDSFTYNLVHILREIVDNDSLDIFRNDKISLEEVGKYDKILLSPGPGIPEEAGIMPELIKKYGSSKSILGVCLGHQAIAEAYGAELYNLEHVLHGIEGDVILEDNPKISYSVCSKPITILLLPIAVILNGLFIVSFLTAQLW